jgi:DNA-binding transcriptional LysR family regulator
MNNADRLNWHDLKYLLMLTRHGGAKAAASALQVSHQTVSRRLSQLERDLGLRLINKHKHPWTLTVQGAKICKMAAQMDLAVQDIVQASQKEQTNFSGTVSITSVQWGFDLLILPALQTLREKYPKLMFQLIADDAPLDVQSGDADIALRFSKAPPPDLIGTCIGPVHRGVFGTPDLIQRLDAGQADTIPMIKVTAPAAHQAWTANEDQFQSVITVNDFATLVNAVQCGLGIAALPTVVGRRCKTLCVSRTRPLKPHTSAWILRNEDSRGSQTVRAVEAEIMTLGRVLLGDPPETG